MIQVGNTPSKTAEFSTDMLQGMSLEQLAEVVKAAGENRAKEEAKREAEAAAKRDAEIRTGWTGLKTAVDAVTAAMPEGDDSPLDLDAIRTAWSAVPFGEFAAAIKAPKTRRNGGVSVPRSSSIRDEIVAWHQRNQNADGTFPAVKPGALTTAIDRPSSGAVRNILVGDHYSDGEDGGLLKDGYVEVTDASVLTVQATAKMTELFKTEAPAPATA